MIQRSFKEIALAASLMLPNIFFLLLTDQASSQSVLKNLMMMSPEWIHSEGEEAIILHRSTRSTTNAADWFLPTKGCNPTCRKETSADICANPPTRKELCKLLNNEDWCCQEWSYHPQQTLYFKSNCDVVCVAYAECPYSTCRRCAEINNNHECCKIRKCATEKVFASPDGTALEIFTGGSPGRSVLSDSATAEMCPAVSDTICKNYNGLPASCRQVIGCAYNCASGTCQNSGNIYGHQCLGGCFNHCEDKCGCVNLPGCIWEGASGLCKSKVNKYCTLQSFPDKECARKGKFYSVGGVVCENLAEKGDCELDFVVVAANLGSDTAQIDIEGIEYRPEAEIQKEDPFNISHAIDWPSGDIKTDSSRDQQLYATAVTGNPSACRSGYSCFHYVLPTMTWDGNYELALRMVEGVYTEKSKRMFSVRFAGEEVLSEFDVLSYSGEQFRPIDVYVNFQVSKKGKTITVKGHKSRRLNTTVKLSLCHAECGEDNSFIMSAFHIIKQKMYTPRDPCKQIPVPECDSLQFEPLDCQRPETNITYYAFGGKFCRNLVVNEANALNCADQNLIRAINLNGLWLVDSRGIEYEQDNEGNVNDKFDIKRGRDSYQEAFGYANAQDRDLYNTLIYGDLRKLQQCAESCLSYEIQFSQDGIHELAVRTADDESDGPGQRKFSVLLGDIAVFPEVDLFHLTGKKSQAVDLTLNFQVTNNVTNLRLKGYHPKEKSVIKLSPEQTANLSFCPSKCGNTASRNWLVGSFSVVSFIPSTTANQTLNSTCSTFNANPCGCIDTTFCDYNVGSGWCVKRMGECPPPKQNQCRRRGVFGQNMYLVGGVLCTNSKVHSCPPSTTVIGVNFGLNSIDHTDVDGILYSKYDVFPVKDPQKLLLPQRAPPGKLEFGYSPNDYELYKTVMLSQHNDMLRQCLHYTVPSQGNGLFELAVLTGEVYYSQVRKREFSILFNRVPIVEAFEPAQYRFPPLGFSLRVNYKVFGNADKVQMEGYPVSDIKSAKKEIELSFCTGMCSYESRNFTVSAFSVTKYSDGVPCSDMNNDSCACQFQINCEYNLQGGQCMDMNTVCSFARETGDECRRGGSHVFYAHAGQVCPTTGPSGNCSIDQVVLAVNFGNGTGYHKDIHGIEYVSSKTLTFDDPDDTRQYYFGLSPRMKEGVPTVDVPLYRTYEWGRTNGKNKPQCISFPIPTAGDGEYEMSIKTGEVWHDTIPPRRAFSYKLNGMYIVKEFEPARYARPPKAMDLNVNFRVVTVQGEQTIALRGQSSTVIDNADRSVPFEMCHGQCGWSGVAVDINWHISAISVVKLKSSYTSPPFNGDACGCRYNGHQYNVVTKTCVDKDKACSGGCQVDNVCQRGGDNVFYVRAGIICSNSETLGNCVIEKTVFAVNIFGNEHTDINGITFLADAGVPFDDPFKVRRKGITRQQPIEGVPMEDMELYNTSMFSATFQDLQTCVTYHVPNGGGEDGDYELAVKFAEVWWTAAGMREFSYYFNGQVVVQSLDMAAVRGGSFKGFDLLVNYKVNQNKLKMSGYPESDIKTTDKSIPIAFCPGTCLCPPWRDKNFQVAAMSVVKFKTT